MSWNRYARVRLWEALQQHIDGRFPLLLFFFFFFGMTIVNISKPLKSRVAESKTGE